MNAIDRLKNDRDYYGDFGRRYLSASDIGTLLTNPREFRMGMPDEKPLMQGRTFHQFLLEPEKVKDTETIDVTSRTTKVYKQALEESGKHFIMLQKEFDEAKSWADAMKQNIHFFENIYREDAEYEVPAIGEIFGEMWKGKADVVLSDMLIDLKTTRELDRFKYSARSYNYDAQCYVYQQLFDKPLVFYVIDKSSHQLGVFRPGEDFIRRGKAKVEKAVEVYRKFFSPNATEDVKNHYVLEELD